MPSLPPAFFNPRLRSLARANFLVLGSLVVALRLSHFPHLQTNFWIGIPLTVMTIGTLDTLRCMRTRWNFYHGGVILCAYMDLMVLVLTLFLMLYPALL